MTPGGIRFSEVVRAVLPCDTTTVEPAEVLSAAIRDLEAVPLSSVSAPGLMFVVPAFPETGDASDRVSARNVRLMVAAEDRLPTR